MDKTVTNLKTFRKGQLIFKEGQEANVAYMIQKGTVQIYRILNNKRAVLDILHEGEIFGEMGVISRGERTANAEAMAFTELVVLTDKVVQGLLSQSPKTIQYLMHLLIKRLKKADQKVKEQSYTSPMLSVCNIFDLMYRDWTNGSDAGRGRGGGHVQGLRYSEICARIKDIVLITQSEIDVVFSKLESFDHVAMTEIRAGDGKDRLVRMTDPANFLRFARQLSQELERGDEFFATRLQEFIDIYDFARRVETTPDILYKKMAQGEIPDTIFFINAKTGVEWSESQPRDFFKTVKIKRRKPEEFDSLSDIVHVDASTLQEAFSRLGFYKVGVLAAVANASGGEDVRNKLFGSMSRKIADVVKAEAGRGVDPLEAEEVVDELIMVIKELKGVRPQAAKEA